MGFRLMNDDAVDLTVDAVLAYGLKVILGLSVRILLREGFDRWRTVNKGVEEGRRRDTRPTLENKGTTWFATPPHFRREEVFYFAIK